MILSLLLSAALFPQDADNSLRSLEPMDLFQLEGLMNPTVSPDGTKVLFTRIGYDVMSDRRRGELWIYSTATKDARPIIEDVGGAEWSPSGNHIAYVTGAGEDGSEIYVRWMDDGTTRQVTRLPKSPSNIAWSPDGTQLAFSMDVEREVEPLAKLPSAPKGAKWAPAMKVIERFKYRGDGAGYLENTDRHLFVVNAFGGTPRQLTAGAYNHGGRLTWTSSREILFSANLQENHHDQPNNSDLWLLNVDTKDLTQITDRQGPDGGAVYDAVDKRLYWTGFDDRRQGHQQPEISSRKLIPADDGADATVQTTDFDKIPSSLKLNGNELYFSYAERGVTKVAQLVGGNVQDLGNVQLHGFGPGRPYSSGEYDISGGTLAYVGGDPTWPGELYVKVGGADTVRVTDINADLKSIIQLGEVTERVVESESDDKRQIQSWMITPPNYDPAKTYPAILEIHGGPFLSYGPQFSFELQLMAAHGYVVLYGNPRGSTSYGEAFANAIHHDYPNKDYGDLMAIVSAAVAEKVADEGRLFVTGGSGGGVLTAWIVGSTNRFAAAVVAKPVINWISFALTADAYDFFWQYWFPAAPWDNFEHYWKRSPLSKVGNVSTPTMLLTGENDFRTPISESEQFYQALKIRGVETALVRVPDAGHSIASRPSHLLAKVMHILGWFERER